jgi:hypothetical protein
MSNKPTKGRLHTESECLRVLKKLGLQFGRVPGISRTQISNPNRIQLGNKAFGRIDFLVKHKYYTF